MYLCNMKRFALSVLLLLCGLAAAAQTTKVRGTVTDADSGDPIPFAGVFFKGTTIGITADLDGRFTLETRDSEATVLVCQLLGYDTVEMPVRKGSFTQCDFKMKLTDNRLSGAVVKADNRLIKRLLSNIDKHRGRNDPERRPVYTCDVYNKMELDLTHAQEILTGKRFLREFGFVFDYMDTSAVSGVPYLPAMISESVVQRRHTSNPDADDETVIANRISGINPDSNMLSQFTGSMHLKINFYKPFINSFNVEFPSPIQNAGLLYYNYFIIDTLQVDGRKTYLVRYHPKNGISSPAFDGEMQIDAEEFAIRSIHAKMKRGGNINWLRDFVIDAEYERLPDSTWFYKQDKMYADFSIALGDSSKVMSVIGTRQLDFSNPDFSDKPSIDRVNGPVKVESDSNHKSEEYWNSVRPYALTQKEKDIYKMVEQIQDMPLYQTLYTTVYTIVTGYLDLGPVGIGPYLKLISFNNLEGFRPRVGIHTSKNLSRKYRFTGFLAYGTRDREFKGGVSTELLFSREPTRKLTVDAHYDVIQLGRGTGQFTDNNILSSIWHGQQKLCPMSSYSVLYEHEFAMDFNASAEVALKRYYANGFVPMMRWDGTSIGSLATNELHLQARFSKEETVNRGHFIKTYMHTNYPVWTIDLTGSVSGLRKGDCGFFRPELTMDWKFRIPPAGMSKLHINAGTIVGTVPWPMLHLHEANSTNLMDKSAFSCMDYFEFASDTWVTALWYHNFNGFFLGKIPLLKKLNLREELTAKLAWGSLRDTNNGTLPGYGAPLQFPDGMTALGKVPYVELGAGISNIFRLVRVDFIYRLTHRQKQMPDGTVIAARRPWTINVGLEFRF